MRGEASPRRGSAMREVGLIEDGAVLVAGGQIVAVGATRELLRDPWLKRHRKEVLELDCSGKVVIPGFVDAHTHPVFVRPRLVDFEKRVSGATYEEIAEAGGGIRSSVEAVRNASESQLAEIALAAFREMATQGTTTIEAKSGYGLTSEAEIKSLRALARAAREFGGTVVPTLLGAHVPPPEHRSDPDGYVDAICGEMIPQAAQSKLARFVDVFMDRGAFTCEQTVRIFETAGQHGLAVRAHVCQLTGAKLEPLMRFRPVSLDHLDCVSDEDVQRLAQLDCVATLVPGANYFLATKSYPPARKLIDSGVPVALATDYNPGSSPTSSMPLILSLACTQMRMTPAEALTAATINGAHSLALGDRKGSIEPGKDADFAFFALEDYREIAYWFGTNHCVATMMQGKFFE